MWAVRWGVLFAGVSLAYCRQAYSAYRYPGEGVEEPEYSEYDEEDNTMTLKPAILDPLARIRRFGTQPTRTPDTAVLEDLTGQMTAPILTESYGTPTRTPDRTKLEEIKGAIKEILAGRNIDPTAAVWTTDSETTAGNNFTDIYDYLLKLQAARDMYRRVESTDAGTTGDQAVLPMDTRTTGEQAVLPTDTWTTGDKVMLPTDTWTTGDKVMLPTDTWTTGDKVMLPTDTWTTGDQALVPTSTDMDNSATNPLDDSEEYYDKKIPRQHETLPPTIEETTFDPNATTTTTTTVKTTPKITRSTRMVIDADALIDIIANLTYEYEMDLVDRFNETLIKYSVPTCGTPTTTTVTSTTTLPRFPIEDHPVVAKCFVCGLDTPEIPRNAFCADAFAGDFLPLVPVDPSAKGQIARYRKYCRYMDVNNYKRDGREPRSLLGRWTGGCSVRWTDLSGVYTQRSCRNRRHATTGLHFGSKRMAKLEMTLSHVDDGCIISPMASLLPLSRGISLFARFHACVCTGSWCNRAHRRHWMPNYSILTLCLMSQIYA